MDSRKYKMKINEVLQRTVEIETGDEEGVLLLTRTPDDKGGNKLDDLLDELTMDYEKGISR